MYPFRRDTNPSLALTVANDAGVRRQVQLVGGSFTYLVLLVLRVTVVVSVASATSIKFPGSASQAFDYVGINENGTDRVLLDPRVGAFIGQMRAVSGLTSKRMTSLAVGTYNLVETIPIWFSNPNSLNPGETAFREQNPVAPTYAFVQLSSTAAANIAVNGPATVTVSAASVDVIQLHNPNQKTAPWYIPFISQKTLPVAGASTQALLPLMTSRALAALVIQTESTFGLVPDVINNFRLQSDIRPYIGPQMTSWENAGRFAEDYFGGAVYTPQTTTGTIYSASDANGVKPYQVGLDFQHHGQLSTMIDPNDTNLRLEIDCQPSSFGASSLIRVTTIEMARDLTYYAAPGGGTRQLCNSATPPWIAAA